jgi:glutaredoxin 3
VPTVLENHQHTFERNQMNIVIYTKAQCPNCVTAKQLLKSKGLEYEERNIEDPGERMSFSLLFPDIRQMPQIFIDGQRVGGLAGLQVALEQVGL